MSIHNPEEHMASSFWEEAHWRSLFKAFSWRIFATLTTIILSYIILHNIKFALTIGFLEGFAKIGLFYLHERVWNLVPAGKRFISTK